MTEADLPVNFNPHLYLNRWVAVVRQRVVGVGLTREQAERAAKQIRPKDKPCLCFVDANGILTRSNPKMLQLEPETWLNSHPLLQKTVQILQARQIESYLVGGAVRDFLLGRPNIEDLDFAVPGDGLAVARLVADALRAAYYPLDVERATGRVVCDVPNSPDKIYLDFASFRGKDLTGDLLDRDFTLNAIALSLTTPPRLIDPAHGQRDLAAGQIKMVTDTAFQHDPVRVIRAVRQAQDFGFVLEPATAQAIRRDAGLLPRVSVERQRDELLKLLNTPAPGRAVAMLHALGVLPALLPEVAALAGVAQSPPHHLDVFAHTCLVLDNFARMARAGWPDIPARYRAAVTEYFERSLAGQLSLQKLMPLAIVLHDTGKPAARTEDSPGQVKFVGHEKESAHIAVNVAQRLHLSGQVIDFIELVVKHHMRPGWLVQEKSVSRRAIFRFFRDTTGKGVQAGVAVALHALADHDATFPAGAGKAERRALLALIIRLLADFFDQHDRLVDPPLLLNGRDLITELGLKEGRLIGQLLLRLKEAQAVGEVHNRAEAIEFIKTDPDFGSYRAGNL